MVRYISSGWNRTHHVDVGVFVLEVWAEWSVCMYTSWCLVVTKCFCSFGQMLPRPSVLGLAIKVVGRIGRYSSTNGNTFGVRFLVPPEKIKQGT